jgi:hypothetical protein
MLCKNAVKFGSDSGLKPAAGVVVDGGGGGCAGTEETGL